MSVLTAVLFYFLVEGPLAQVERLIFKGPKVVINYEKTHEEGERKGKTRKKGEDEKGGREGSEEGVVVAVAVSDAASEDSTVVMMKAVSSNLLSP